MPPLNASSAASASAWASESESAAMSFIRHGISGGGGGNGARARRVAQDRGRYTGFDDGRFKAVQNISYNPSYHSETTSFGVGRAGDRYSQGFVGSAGRGGGTDRQWISDGGRGRGGGDGGGFSRGSEGGGSPSGDEGGGGSRSSGGWADRYTSGESK